MARYRELTLVTTWLFFRYCHHLLVRASARSLDTRVRRLTLAPQLIKKAMQVETEILQRKHTEDATAPAPVTHDIPEQFTDQDVLLYLLRGSPKLRALLSMIQQEVFLQQEKSVVWCTTPAQQFFIAAALHHARIDCRVFHSKLNSKERVELVRDFTTKVVVGLWLSIRSDAKLHGLFHPDMQCLYDRSNAEGQRKPSPRDRLVRS